MYAQGKLLYLQTELTEMIFLLLSFVFKLKRYKSQGTLFLPAGEATRGKMGSGLGST